jgi:hypothetical protein
MAIETKLEKITPQKAEAFLRANTSNRRLRPTWVAALVGIIQKDQWQVTHQGIAFNCDGGLLDGQHRLTAIAQAGKSVMMHVTRGLPRDAMFAIDQGKIRQVSDITGIEGLEPIPKAVSAVARAMMEGILKMGERVTFVVTNRDIIEAIDFACDQLRGDMSKAILRAVVARAFYTADRERLEQFCRHLMTGEGMVAADSGANKLRTMVLMQGKLFRGSAGRHELYCKAEAALRGYLASTPMSKLYVVESEQFPLPGEGKK